MTRRPWSDATAAPSSLELEAEVVPSLLLPTLLTLTLPREPRRAAELSPEEKEEEEEEEEEDAAADGPLDEREARDCTKIDGENALAGTRCSIRAARSTTALNTTAERLPASDAECCVVVSPPRAARRPG